MTDNEFRAIVRAIHDRLDVIDEKLDTILGTDEGGAGVREPVTPAPESPGDAIASDYAESAE